MTDEQRIQAYLKQHPDADPKKNPLMREQVNAANYHDRGMWGPYGGKNGTVSQIWLEQQRALDDNPSELGLMTVVEPPANE